MRRPLVLISLVLCFACAKEDYARLYHSVERAPSLEQAKIEALDHLGPTIIDRGVNFGVYSENATKVDLLVFEDPESNRPSRVFPMTRFGDVWNVHVEGLGVGTYYGYRAWGPNWEFDPKWYPGSVIGFKADVDALGNRYNPNKLLLDPWAKALHRDHDWGKGSLATGPDRAVVTYGASAKSLVVQSQYEWGEEEQKYRSNREDPNWVGHRFEDLIVYEVHLKGFTASASSGVTHPGTYRGLAEKADYFKELGVTAVELLPIHEKPIDGGYWGYQTLNFFAPEISYAATKRPQEVIDEFKFMVEALHQRGIEVIVDVVYNHTGEGGLWREKLETDDSTLSNLIISNYDPAEVAGLYSYRGLDNQAYYALYPPDRRQYWNDTGVGNQTRANHTPMRRLILDSLRFYVEELHVDGFRFDLAPVLGAVDVTEAGGVNQWPADIATTVLQDILEDPILQRYNTRLIAEPWSAAGFFLAGFPASKTLPGHGWGEWNAHFRDFWRGFMNEDLTLGGWKLNDPANPDDDWKENPGGGEALTGSSEKFGTNGRKPFHSSNFITVHDGFTLYDLVSYDRKKNACGPLNPVCCEQPLGAFCDRDSGENHNRSKNWGAVLPEPTLSCSNGGGPYAGHGFECGSDKDVLGEGMKRQMMRNSFVAMLISHGMPLLYGGDEWMRTQLGNNNAYSTRADNPFNWFDWGTWQTHDHRWRMYDFVKDMIALRKEHAYAFAPKSYDGAGAAAPFSWKNATNGESVDWHNTRHVAMHYYDATRGPELFVAINMEANAVDFALPAGRSWKRLVDTQSYFDRTDASQYAPAFAREGFLSEPGLDLRQSHNISLAAPEAITTSTYGVAANSIVILRAE